MNFLLALMTLFTSTNMLGHKYESITVDDGLSNMIVRCTSQDNNGVLWFATNSGMQSFDGTNFTDYHIQNMDGASSSDNRFQQVLTNKQGKLFAINRSNVFKYNRLSDRFEAIFSFQGDSTYTGIINLINILEKDRIFVSTNHGLYISRSSGELPYEYLPIGDCNGTAVYDNNIFVATSNGIIKLEVYADKYQPIAKHRFTSLGNAPVRFIYADRHGNIWLQQKGGGIVFFDTKGKKTIPEWNSVLANKPVRAITEYDGLFVIAIDGLGLLYCDSQLHFIAIDKPNDDDEHSLTIDGIYHLFRDRDNYLWISTFAGGVNYINPNSWGFHHIKHELNNKNSLSNNSVRAIMEDSDGNLWFGNKNGVSCLNERTGKWKHLRQLPSNTVLALAEDIDNNIWISAFSAGIIVCDKKLNILRTLNRENSSLLSDDIFVIFRDSDSDMWLSGENGILSLVKTSSEKIIEYKTNNVVRSIIELKTGKIIATGSAGIDLIHKETGKVDRIYPPTTGNSKVSMIYSIIEDNRKHLWIASEGDGIMKIDTIGNILEHISTKEGLISNVAYGLELSPNGHLWISTNKGLSRYDINNKSIINFTKDAGLGMSGFMYCCHTPVSNGRLAFGGIGGAVVFNPANIHYSYKKRPLIFTHLHVSNQLVTPGKDAPIKKAINECENIILKHYQNAFSIGFNTVSPIDDVSQEYEWMLEGIDREWSPSSADNMAVYNNLPSGKYLFKVRTSHVHSEETVQREISIIILPAWWETWWAYLLYTLFVIGTALFVFQHLQGVIRSRVNANKVKLFAGIAHDIKTPLSIIRLLLSNIRHRLPDNDLESHKDIKLAISHSDHLADLANKLLEVEKSTNEVMPVKVAKYRIEASIDGISYAFASIIAHKNIQLEFKFPDTPTWAWFDMNMFQKVIYNLLDNAIKYTPNGGKVIVSTSIISKVCRIIISDTGIGIPDSEKKKILKEYFRATNAVNSSESGSGVGLLLVKELVKHMGGNISFSSKEGEGTTFIVELPLGKEHIKHSDIVIEDYALPKQFPAGHHKIMIVEDNTELRNVICQQLEGIYTIFAVGDGKEALEMLEESVPDIVITDYMMPRMNGIELCKHMKKQPQFKYIPIIMLTSLSSNEHKIEGFNVGVDAYIEKPFDMNVLLSRIENIIHNRNIILKSNIEPLSVDTDLQESSENHLLRVFEAHVLELLSDSDFSVEDICNQMGIGYTTFYRKIKSMTGKTPVDIINEIRLKKAEEYLSSGKYTASQVGYMTGFSSPSYFAKVYKKYFGYTPSQKVRKN